MITVAEAQAAVAAQHRRCETVAVPLEEALGSVLAADVISDIDSPPHDKALVDGYAVRSQDVPVETSPQRPVELKVLEEVTAGRTPTRPLAAGQATRVMTGAPIPEGCDSMVMVEHTETNGATVRVLREAPAERNLMRRATSLRRGETVLTSGRRLRPIDIGVLAEVGCVRPAVIRQPTAAILATGDELVDADQSPGPGAIRNSNGPLLAALIHSAGAAPQQLGVARDTPGSLREKIRAGLQADILLLSGGVSAGVHDLVPQAMADCDVREIFHKVRLKPGKPLWFGVGPQRTLVFGLPGNPVSGLVCFELFVRPALAAAAGWSFEPQEGAAPLEAPFEHRGDRPTWHPARRVNGRLQLLRWRGSADQRTLTGADCLAVFEAGDRSYEAGEVVAYRELP